MANDYQLIFGNFDEEALAKSWDWLNDKELKYRIVNKLLYRVMKKKYEEFVFYLIPVNYLMNNEVKNEYTFRTEVVSVKVKKPVNMILNNRLEMEIKHTLG